MTQTQVRQHVLVIGWLNFASSFLFVLFASFVFSMMMGIGIISDDATAFSILSAVGTVAAIALSLIALPGFVAAYGLLRRKSWGRIVGIVAGALSLPAFPLGTALGVYSLVVLSNPATAEYFGETTPSSQIIDAVTV